MRRTNLTAAVIVVSLATVGFAQQTIQYKVYRNARFNYSISYPSRLLVPQGESTNGDGQKFATKDGRAELIVFGSNNALDQTLEEAFNEAKSITGNRVVTYQTLKQDWFVVSGLEGGRIFYQKTFLRGDVFKTMRIEYAEQLKTTYDAVTTKVSLSFKG